MLGRRAVAAGLGGIARGDPALTCEAVKRLVARGVEVIVMTATPAAQPNDVIE
jgi:hypothetical protein